MTWFRVDDMFYRHAKVRKLGKDRVVAVGLWLLCGIWSAENGTDGFVSSEQVEIWDPRRKAAQRLVDVGLWHAADKPCDRCRTELPVPPADEPGYLFHDWLYYQPSSQSVESKREEWRQKKAAYRKGVRGKMSTGDTPKDNPRDTTQDGPRDIPQDSPGESEGESRPTRIPYPFRDTLGGDRPVSDRARRERPPTRCTLHANIDQPPPCRACGEARQGADAWDRAEARIAAEARSAGARSQAELRARAIADCPLCDQVGYIGRVLCDHDPAAPERAARGRAAVQAALAKHAPEAAS